MNIQQSFSTDDRGCLYVVPTPIGNLEDITYRALRILKESSMIAAEDTRNTKKLLRHFDIHTPLISYHEHNKEKRKKEILQAIEAGKQMALVSDAGMPAISDPGLELIQQMIQRDFSVIVLPGANAALMALVASGLSTHEFLFYGFLPRRQRDQEKELNRLKSLTATIIFYESPYRIVKTLQTISEQFGNRKVVVARELTKRYEEYIRGQISDVLEELKSRKIKGEISLIIEGSTKKEKEEKIDLWWNHLSVIDHVLYYTNQKDYTNRDAIQQVALDRKMPRRQVYQLFHTKKS